MRSAHKPLPALALAIAVLSPVATAETETLVAAADIEQGRALYDKSCAGCHTANKSWRNRRAADSWPALLEQVRKWQRIAGAPWQPAQVNDVAAYMNREFYGHPCPTTECE